MSRDDSTNVGVLFARVGYQLLSLEPKDRLQVVSALEKEAEKIKQGYSLNTPHSCTG